MAWSIRNYNAFLKESKAEYGLTHHQAQAMYRRMSEHVERPLYGVDISKHPRISTRFAEKAHHVRRAPPPAPPAPPKRPPAPPARPPAPPARPPAPPMVSAADLWDEYIDEAEDFDYDYLLGSADYGEKEA